MRILYVPEIINDLADVRDWYESRSDGLGDEFIRMAYAAFEELLDFPEKYEEVYGLFHRALMRRFPYSIYYHSSKDPERILQMLGTR